MAKFIPIILPQPGEDLRTWARQLTSQLQSLTAQLSSVLANIEATGGGGGTPTPGGTTTPVKTPDDVTILDANGYYIDGLGRVIVDATGFHVYDLVGFQVINGPNVYINTEHLVENAVKTAQLANDAVTYEKFFPDLVPIKIVDTLPNPVGYTGPGVVWLSTDRKLYRHADTAWTSAVPAVDITGQLTNAQLESIAAAKLTGQIIETQIADDSISTPKLAAGSVNTAKLAAGAVVADTIAANAVTAVKLAAEAVEADKIAANAVTTSKLDANAVTTEKLDALAVTAGKLAAGAVVAGKLAANAIVANDGVIGTAAIADAQIIDLNANKINAGSIAAERMEANIVTALSGKFATLSALASSLGVVQILPGGALLTQGAINYSTGTGVYVDATQLRIGNPAGARLQWTGGALEIYNSSNQLTIASGNVDWAGITGAGKPENGATVGASIATSFSTWDLFGQQLVAVSDGKVGNTVLRLAATGGYPTQPAFVPIDPTKKYRVRFWARPSTDCNGLLYFSLRQAVNETGTWGPANGGRAPYRPSAQTRAGHNSTYGTDAWGEYSYIWDAADWQAGVKFFRPEFLDNYGGTAGHWDVQGLVIEEATDVEAAKDAANAAQLSANTANNTLADIAADNKLTAVEKQAAANEWGIINRERASIQAQASALGIVSELNDYDYTYAVLNDYITPLLQDISSTSAIDGATFRDKWSYFYEYRQRLLNKMAAVAATRADWARVSNKTGFASISQITSSNVTTYIDNAAIGNAQVGGNLWSTNWNYAGGTGWLLDRSGNFYGNNIYARGDIEASSLKANTAMVNRANIVNAAVDTLQIEGNAVTIPVAASGTSSCQTPYVDFNSAPLNIIVAGNSDLTSDSSSSISGSVYLDLYRNGSLIGSWRVVSYHTTGGMKGGSVTAVFQDNPGAGAFYYTAELRLSANSSFTASNQSVSVLVIGTRR